MFSVCVVDGLYNFAYSCLSIEGEVMGDGETSPIGVPKRKRIIFRSESTVIGGAGLNESDFPTSGRAVSHVFFRCSHYL